MINRSRTYSSEGVVLARRNYGESDRILTVYSKHYGKLSLLAKGVRKPKSKKRGHVEVFSHIKFSVSKNHGFDLMTEAELIESFEDVRRDLRKISVAYYLCEVISKIMHDEECNEALYTNFLEILNALAGSNNLKSLRKKFVVDTLVSLGFWPFEKEILDPDKALEEVVERRINSFYVGRKILN